MIRKIGLYYQSDRNFKRSEVYKNNIEVIVNLSAMAKDRSAEFYPDIEYYKIPIKDCVKIPDNIIKSIFYLTKNKKSLIHCYMGYSRSVAVIYKLHELLKKPITVEYIKSIDNNFLPCPEILF